MRCLVNEDGMELISFESSLTLSDGINGISLRKLEKNVSKISIIKAISFLLLRLADNFNVNKNITPEQAAIASCDLLEVFGYETLEDVTLMFKYVRQGKIGGVNSFSLDHQVIFNVWVPAYLELKAQERENIHATKKSEKNNILNFNWDGKDVDKLETTPVQLSVRDRMELIMKRTKLHEAKVRIDKAKQQLKPKSPF